MPSRFDVPMREPSTASRSLPDVDIAVLWRSLHRHVSVSLRAADRADDVVQDAWLRFLSRPPDQRERVRGWLRVVAERLVLEDSRRRRSRLERERAVARAEVENVHARPSAEDSLVLRRLAELRDPYREVVRLRYLDDLATAEIAARLGRSQATVRSQIKRGLDLLRTRLGDREHQGAAVRRAPLTAGTATGTTRGPSSTTSPADTVGPAARATRLVSSR